MSNLVLTRATDEAVCIETPDGDVIEVAVVKIRGTRVRLAFNADHKYKILRKEIREVHAHTFEERLDIYLKGVADHPAWDNILDEFNPIAAQVWASTKFNEEEHTVEEIEHNAICAEWLVFASAEEKAVLRAAILEEQK